MAGIVCAIRGGPASQPTIARAIQLAQESKQPIHFLFVVNTDFLARTGTSRTHTISHELEQMGEFILLTARGKAEAEGVTAFGAVRHGNVTEQVVGLSQELNAAFVVLGKPRGQTEKNTFDNERFQQFVDHIQRETGAEIVFAQGDGE